MGKVSTVTEKAFKGSRLVSCVISKSGSLYRANIVCGLKQPASAMVGISIVGDVFSQNEVERIVQGDADCALAVVVINGNRIEPLEESEMIENECGQIATDF